MGFCIECDNLLKEDAKFCNKCGKVVVARDTTAELNRKIVSSVSKKGLIPIFVLVGVIIIVVSTSFMYLNRTIYKIRTQLKIAERCLASEDYIQAVTEFRSAIVIDPMNVRSYMGAAEAYMAQEHYENAIKVLEIGYKMTTSDEIDEKRVSYQKEKVVYDYLTEAKDYFVERKYYKAIMHLEMALVETSNDVIREQLDAYRSEQWKSDSLLPNIETGEYSRVEFGGIEWRVLDIAEGMALIISEQNLEGRPYHNSNVDITWVDCDVRDYLNDEFYNSFSSDDRAKINTVTNKCPDNPWHGTVGGVDTQDKIFTLCLEEVIKYFGDSGKLQDNKSGGVDFNDQYNRNRSSNTWWFLRSPGRKGNDVAYINYDGRVSVAGYYVDYSDYGGGVRPAMWVNLQ